MTDEELTRRLDRLENALGFLVCQSMGGDDDAEMIEQEFAEDWRGSAIGANREARRSGLPSFFAEAGLITLAVLLVMGFGFVLGMRA